jgi:general secretion pathway protein D
MMKASMPAATFRSVPLPAFLCVFIAFFAMSAAAWGQPTKNRRRAPAVIVPSAVGIAPGVPGIPVAQPTTVIPGQPVGPGQVVQTNPGVPGSIIDAAGAGTTSMHEFDSGMEYRPLPPGARITFNLQDADLPDLVRAIGNITGRRFIIPGKVRSIKTTIYSPTKITPGEAYQAFLSVLEVNGMTVVPSGRYLKIEETAGIATQVTPTYAPGSEAPVSDQFITRIVRLRNMSAEDASNLLGHFKSRDGDITPYATTNTLIITDTGANIRRMLQILGEVDVAAVGEQIWVEPVHYAVASELQARINEILGGAGQPAAPRPGAGDLRLTRILADDRSNSLVIVATQRMYLRVLELMRRLDVSIEGEGQIRIYRLQHADAEEISQSLNNITGGGRAPGAQGAARGQNAVFEGQVRITADKPTNALVITSSPRDYVAVRRVIDELDRSRRQVFIEAVIVELQVNRTNRLGLNFHGGGFLNGTNTEGGTAIGGFDALSSVGLDPSALSGLALGLRGPSVTIPQGLLPSSIGVTSIPGFGVTLTALATTGDANVLATPNIIATDNTAANINVGQNVPLQTNVGGGLGALAGQAGASGLLGGLGGLGGGFAAPRQDVGTKINILPHINDSGEVRMEIEEEISEVGATTGQLGAVSINRRTAKTTTVVRDQNTVVIGGLIRTAETSSEQRIPILGDIPILGALFRKTEHTLQRTNLLLFLTPYVIRDQSDLRRIFERKMRERQEFIDRYFVFSGNDYEPPMDYTRTNGLVEEIRRSIREIRERTRLEIESERVPPPPHSPSDSIDLPADLRPSSSSNSPVVPPATTAAPNINFPGMGAPALPIVNINPAMGVPVPQ